MPPWVSTTPPRSGFDAQDLRHPHQLLLRRLSRSGDQKRWLFAIKVSVEQSEEQVMRGNLSHLLRIDGQIGAETW